MISVAGLSLHKASPPWPPPSNDVSYRIRSGLRTRKNIVDVLHRRLKGARQAPQPSRSLDLEDVVPMSLPTTSASINVSDRRHRSCILGFRMRARASCCVQFSVRLSRWPRRSSCMRPVVSPALSYLGGLSPLFFIISDKELLRDEVIFACVLFPAYFLMN